MNIPACDNLQLREDAEGVTIPLAANSNDKGALFAGSIYAGAIVAGYRAAERLCAARGLTGNLVAKTAMVNYLKRIETDGRAVAARVEEPVLKPNGNHAVRVVVTLADASGTTCAEVSAEMILLAKRSS